MKNEDQSYEEKYVESCAEISKNMEKHDRIQSIGFDELKIYPKLDNSYNENNNEKFCGVDPDLIGFNIILSQGMY